MGRNMHRGVVLGLVAAFAVAGCSSGAKLAAKNQPTPASGASTTAPAVATTTTTTLPAPNLKAEVLALSDMPTGWSVDKSSASSGNGPKCFTSAKTDLKAVDHAEADFVNGSNGAPALDEGLGYLPGHADTAFNVVSKIFDSCGQISFSSGGYTFSGTVGQMSFPSLGDQSTAWQVSLSTQASGLTITAGVDVLVFRKSDTVGALIYTDLGTPDVSTFQTFAQKAVAKVH